MLKSEQIYIKPKRDSRLPRKYRELGKPARGDRWLAMWLVIGAGLWGACIYWWLR